MQTDELAALAKVTANLVFGYQGSDPEIIKKQVGIENAVETLKDAFEYKLSQQREQVLSDFSEFCHTKYEGCVQENGEWFYQYKNEVVNMADEYLESLK